ncbi:myb-like protein W [Tribolium madens]|uniref:myb-like protein W n=1 Tax=Tribolium madens TaxID=41895 RepID=UPI001CF71FE5|nr:myb-like protein W [Tribolium madens]XP_044269865.1 myb-like protein W [Tribolium madens]
MEYNFNKSDDFIYNNKNVNSLKREHNSDESFSPEKKLKSTKNESPSFFPLEIKEEILSSDEKKKKKKEELDFGSVDVTIPSKKSKKKNHTFGEHKKSRVKSELSTDLFENNKKKKKKEHNTLFVTTSSEEHSADEKLKDKKKKEKGYDEPLEIKQEILSSGEKKKKKKEEFDFGLEGETTQSKKSKNKKHAFGEHKKSSDKSQLSTDLFENKKKKKEHNTLFVTSFEEHSADEKFKNKKKKENGFDEPLEECTKNHKKKLKKKKEVYDVEMEETEKVSTDKITKECFTESTEEEEPKKKKKKKRHCVDSEMSTDYSIINENLNDTEILTPEKVKHKKKKHSSNETSDIITETEVHKKKKKKHKHDKKHKYDALPIEICQTKSDSLENVVRNSKKLDKKSEKLSEEIPETTALSQKSHKKLKNSELNVSDSAVKNSEDEDPKPKKAKAQGTDVKTENTSLDNSLLNDSKDLEKLVKDSERKKVTSESRNFEELHNGLENSQKAQESLKNDSSDSAFEVSDNGVEGFKSKRSKRKRKKSTFNAKIETLISENIFSTDDSEEKPETSGLSLQNRESVVITPDLFFDIVENDKNELSYEERQRLKNFNVLLPWPVHPLHRIETRVAKGPSQKQWKEINALKIKIKHGIFNKSEDEIIRRNWEEFCKLHDTLTNPKYFLRCKTSEGKFLMPIKEKVRFVQFLAHGLPNRLLHTVYMRFQRIFFPKELKTGRFTPEEDNTILEYLKTSRSQTPYADLAKILNRDNFAIEKRHRKLKFTLEGNFRVKWDTEQIAKFMQHFVDVTKVDSVEDLEYRNITSEEWKEMSARLNIPTIRLRPAWLIKIHPRIFINRSVHSNLIKKLLVDVLIEKGESDWRDVNWQEIAEEFGGFTGLALNKMMREIVRTHVPVDKQSDLGECLKCLANENFPVGRKIRKIDVVDARN